MQTSLYNYHLEQSGQLVDFSGWQLPLKYKTSIREEHLWVRKHTGLFDVSHMGYMTIKGPEARHALDYICCNSIAAQRINKATYSPLANEEGYCIDDVIIYCLDDMNFYLVANSANRGKVLNHIKKEATNFDCDIESHFTTHSILALQGPSSHNTLQSILENHLSSPMQCTTLFWQNNALYISTTGYTGEKGFEIILPNKVATSFYTTLLNHPEVKPIGLGARDTLRLEKGYALYGHELTESICPLESVAAWAVKMDKEKFIGKDAMASKKLRTPIALESLSRHIPRNNDRIYYKDKEVGYITSGNFSFSLDKPIALALVDSNVKNIEDFMIKGSRNTFEAKAVSLPFI